MTAKTRETFGTPYTIGEAECFLKTHGPGMDPYLRDLFAWLCAEVRGREPALAAPPETMACWLRDRARCKLGWPRRKMTDVRQFTITPEPRWVSGREDMFVRADCRNTGGTDIYLGVDKVEAGPESFFLRPASSEIVILGPGQRLLAISKETGALCVCASDLLGPYR